MREKIRSDEAGEYLADKRYRALFEHMLNGFAYHRIVTDERGRPVDYLFLEINRSFEELTGLKRNEVLGRRVTEVLPGIESGNFDWIGTYGRVALEGQPVRFEQYSQELDRWYWVSAYSPEPEHFAVTFEDISDRKRAEQEIQRLNTTLEQRVTARTTDLETAIQDLKEFSSAVSHDLKGPLGAIAGLAQLLVEDHLNELSEDGQTLVTGIQTASKRMADVIDALLALSRAARAELEIKTVNISELAESIVQGLRQQDGARQVQCRIEPGLTARGDPRLLHSLLWNLMANAWKFTRKVPSARINVGMCTTDEKQAFFVSDNGAGFNMAYGRRLFKPFQRLHRTDEFEGTGVGLATARRIVQRHGGVIWARSVEGEGATFYFQLPSA